MITLLYIHDPMCSWCWGFAPMWRKLQEHLPSNISVKYLLGGLAADSDLAMPQSMQDNIQQIWKTIQQTIPGTQFNFEFWTKTKPRRSTYPACRAVIAARKQSQTMDKKMILAIQEGYYLRALNPSEDTVLVQFAEEIGLDYVQFKSDLNSADTQYQLDKEVNQSRTLATQGFPSLIVKNNNKHYSINIDYINMNNNLKAIQTVIAPRPGNTVAGI